LKFYLTNNFITDLLLHEDRKSLADQIETLLQNGHRFYTSVYTLLCLFADEKIKHSKKTRTILHLIDELVDEILPIDKKVLEILDDSEKLMDILQYEIHIAILSGMDELVVSEVIEKGYKGQLPLRHLIRKTK